MLSEPYERYRLRGDTTQAVTVKSTEAKAGAGIRILVAKPGLEQI